MNNPIRNWKWNLLLMATAVAVGTATASAQQVTLMAHIPFAFSVSGENWAPGNYVVSHRGPIWRFQSEDSKDSAFIARSAGLDDPANTQPSLTFNCVRSHCQVRAIHVGGGQQGVELAAPKRSKSDAEEFAVLSIPLRLQRAE
jgi:hypothetical protein